MKLIRDVVKTKPPQFAILMMVLILLAASAVLASSAGAQSQLNWSDPTNVSQSGSAIDPVIVVDSDGVYHVIWLDEFAGLMHSSGDGLEWSEPAPLVTPARDIVPFLIADLNGYLHAFWTETDGRLFYSKARAATLPSSSAWQSRALIGNSVLNFDVALDDLGDLHLSYLNPLDSESAPAGIYYRRLRDNTSTWLPPTLLDASPYFRSLDVADSNIDVTTSIDGEDKRIFVAWDNRPRERIYLATSDDDGNNWTEPVEIDQPQPGMVGSGPSNLRVNANGDQVMLLWRTGEEDSFCNQYYQYSQDRGETWSIRQPIYGSTPICLNQVQVSPGDDYTIVVGNADQVYFIAWDGSRWSDPQLEEPLSTFIDSETQNPVELGCLQFIQDKSATMNVIGCDEGIGQDIWSIRRQLQDVESWFPVESGWGKLEDVDTDELKFLSPKILTDDQNRTHLFWSKSESLAPDALGKSINYAVRQAGQWSPTAEILLSSIGKAEQIDAGIDSGNKISIVWSGGQGGEIFFSQADSSQAFIPESWSAPINLPSPLPVGSSPSLVIDDDDVIYITYAIPLNEQRGIYLTMSEDAGQTWSEPALVFDAQGSEWSMVDKPGLAVADNGDLHMIWTRYSLPTGEGPLGLYYASSRDKGNSWSEPALVVDGPVVWSAIVSNGPNAIQRVWQQRGSSGSTLWHEQSVDGGITWERVAPVSVFGEIVANPSLSTDQAGRIHLLLVVRSGVDTYGLQHWVYDGLSWSAATRLDLQFSQVTEIRSISSDFSEAQDLDVVLLNSDFQIDRGQIYQMIYTNHAVEVPEISQTEVVEATPTPPATAIPTPTKETTEIVSSSTATSESPVDFTDEPGNSGASSWISILAPVAIGLIVVIAIALIVRWIRG